MKNLTQERVIHEHTGFEFSYSEGGYDATLSVSKDGQPYCASYGTDRGWCTKSKGDSGFDDAVYMVMRDILKDRNEFCEMRSHLNTKYYEMAESIREEAASRFNF